MKTIIITPATTEPVTLSEAKAQLRIDEAFTVDDGYINALISAARDRVESYCNQFFSNVGIQVLYEGQYPSVLDLPYPNMTVTAITYTDSDNVSNTILAGDYTVDALNQKVYFDDVNQSKNYQVSATMAAPAAIDGVKQGILMVVTDLYELRTETAVGVSLADNPAVKALLYPYRLELGI